MSLGWTQPLTEMSTRNLPRGKGRQVHKADNLSAICEPIVWASMSRNSWAFTSCHRESSMRTADNLTAICESII
jgi:hypothetical protein